MYLWIKLLHVAAVFIFLGNIATGLFWKAHADRSRDPRIIAHTLDGIIRSDRLFTIPGGRADSDRWHWRGDRRGAADASGTVRKA